MGQDAIPNLSDDKTHSYHSTIFIELPNAWLCKRSGRSKTAAELGTFSEMFPVLLVHRRLLIGWAVLEDAAQ